MSKLIAQKELRLTDVLPSKVNVRRRPSDEDVTELANSIEERGVIEPIVVRPKNGKFEVVVGQLRVRAAKEAGLKSIPSIIKEMDDQEARTESLIENIQRHALSPEDEAEAFAELYRVVKSAAKVAEMVGCGETRVSDALAVKGLIETLRERTTPDRASKLVGSVPRKRVLTEAARVAEAVYSEKPGKVAKLIEEVRDLPEKDAKRVLDRVRVYPEKPIEQIKEEVLYSPQSISLSVQFGSKLVRAMDAACKARHVSREEVVVIGMEQWLRREGYFK